MKRDNLPVMGLRPGTHPQECKPGPREAGIDSVTRLAVASIQERDTRAGLIAGGFGLLFLGIAALSDRRSDGGDFR